MFWSCKLGEGRQRQGKGRNEAQIDEWVRRADQSGPDGSGEVANGHATRSPGSKSTGDYFVTISGGKRKTRDMALLCEGCSIFCIAWASGMEAGQAGRQADKRY